MSFTPNDLLKIYVPFVRYTDACSTSKFASRQRSHALPMTEPEATEPLKRVAFNGGEY
jgi:hypothetical protein